MYLKALMGMFSVAVLSFVGARPAHAQFAVIDVASIVQLIQQVQQLEQQVATAKSQLSQAQSEYAAFTGSRGMQNLLSGVPRNYLPTNWTQLSQVQSGSSTAFPALAASVTSVINSNAVLSATQISRLSGSEQTQLAQARQNPALLAATARTALANTSGRFAELQGLIRAIGSSGDPKASLDLTARITAEQGMLQNEATKLQLLYQVVQSQEWARAQRAREQALADQGSLRTLSRMGL